MAETDLIILDVDTIVKLMKAHDVAYFGFSIGGYCRPETDVRIRFYGYDKYQMVLNGDTTGILPSQLIWEVETNTMVLEELFRHFGWDKPRFGCALHYVGDKLWQ